MVAIYLIYYNINDIRYRYHRFNLYSSIFGYEFHLFEKSISNCFLIIQISLIFEIIL